MDIDEIYREHGEMVYAYLLRLCGNDDLARELTQETFLRAIQKIGQFDGRSSVRTWLCSIAKHLYFDAIRKQKPMEELTEDLPSKDDFIERLVRKDQAMVAHRTLHMLEEPSREVFTLHTFCELSHMEIGELFGKSESWARVTYFRARQKLQATLKGEEQ